VDIFRVSAVRDYGFVKAEEKVCVLNFGLESAWVVFFAL
jgi:hypothetical protein